MLAPCEPLEQAVLAIVADWWQRRIVDGIAPAIDSTPACALWVGTRYEPGTEPRDATPEEAAKLRDMARFAGVAKTADATRKRLQSELIASASGHRALVVDGMKNSVVCRGGKATHIRTHKSLLDAGEE